MLFLSSDFMGKISLVWPIDTFSRVGSFFSMGCFCMGTGIAARHRI